MNILNKTKTVFTCSCKGSFDNYLYHIQTLMNSFGLDFPSAHSVIKIESYMNDLFELRDDIRLVDDNTH